MRNLTLFIPGLLGPDTYYSDDFSPKLDAIESLLARSNHTQLNTLSIFRALTDLSPIPVDPLQDVPVAAITRLLDDNERPQGVWMRADPVHLRPDRDGLILMDSFILGLSQHDALAIATEVNKVLSHYGWVLEVPYEDRWYIRMDKAPELTTTELPAMISKDIRHHLPQGKDAALFHNLLNEIQMQLFDCDVNQLRESKGELPVNSVWFWGLGSLPEHVRWDWSVVYSDDAFVRGMAALAGTPCHAVPPDFDTVFANTHEQENVLVVLQHCQAPAQYQNMMLWHQALELLENGWFKSIQEHLRWQKLHNVHIVTEGHRFSTSWLGKKRFWRKLQSPGHYRNT